MLSQSSITYKCVRVVLSRTPVYFATSKLILFSYSFHVPCTIYYSHILFMYHALYFPMFIFILYVPCFPFFLIDHNRKLVLFIKWVIFFLNLTSKIFFLSFQLFENCHIDKSVSTLINVVKLDDENSHIVSTLSNVVNINVEIDNVD